jgi:hypothetical protein
MPIPLTVKELVVLAQAGALGRFLAVPKPIKVGWENRKQGPMADTELKAYNDKRLELLKEVGATLADGSREYTFPDGAREQFQTAHDELMAQTVELPGYPVSLADLKGELSEADLCLLEKFVKE